MEKMWLSLWGSSTSWLCTSANKRVLSRRRMVATLIVSNRGDVQSLLHLHHQLLGQSLPHSHSRHFCVCACVHVVRWVENCRGVLYAGADKYVHCDRCSWHHDIYLCPYSPQGVHMHSCMRILFNCTVQSFYFMRVYHRCFLTPTCVGRRGLEALAFSGCPVHGCILAYIYSYMCTKYTYVCIC